MANRTDTFNRTNSGSALGTPSDSGSAWVEAASNFGIFSNQAYGAGNGSPTLSYLECSAADGTVQLTYVTPGAGSAGLAFRVSDASNFWVVRATTAFGYSVYKCVATTFSLVQTGSHIPANNDVVSVVLSGSSIIVKVNGTTDNTITDSFNAAATKHGLGSQVGDASSLFDSWSFVGGAPATLTQGDPSVTVTSDTTITLLAPAATGGTSPYTYQWQRATAANGSYSNVGTNSLTLADSSGLSAGTTYWYNITATDSAGSPQTATSFPVPAKLSGKAFKVRIIGDSHWAAGSPAGGQNAPTEFVVRLGTVLGPRAVTLGGNSAASGSQSATWVPGATGTPLENAVTAANSSGDNLYVIELGSNDSTNGGGTPVTAAVYGANMALIVAYIKANATGTPLVIALLHPFYYTDPSAFGPATVKDHLDALFSYAAQLDLLADGVTVFTAGLLTRYQIVTAQATYLYSSDLLHLSYPTGQNLSADLAAMDLAGKLQFAGTGGGGSLQTGGGGMTGGMQQS